MSDTEAARLILTALGSVDTMEAQLALLADLLRRQREAWTVKPIRTEADHAAALAEVERLMVPEPAPGTPEADRLTVLAALVTDYESQRFPISMLAEQLSAWETLMSWALGRPGAIAPVAGPFPALRAASGPVDWVGPADGVTAEGTTWSAAAVELARMLANRDKAGLE